MPLRVKANSKAWNQSRWIDEQYTQDIATLVDKWKCNPFDPENQNLWTLNHLTCSRFNQYLINFKLHVIIWFIPKEQPESIRKI